MAKNPLGNWYDGIGTTHENSANREAPNKHIKGGKRYKEMIDRDSKKTDFWKNLPFTFSKPPKRTKAREDIFHICDLCNHVSMVSAYRVAHTCHSCKQYTSVNDSNKFFTEEAVTAELEARLPDTTDE